MFSSTGKIITFAAMLGVVLANPVPQKAPVTNAKPTGGPAAMELKVFSGPFTCGAPGTPIPDDGTAGTLLKTITIPEATCAVTNFPLQGAFTATLTATPKTGTAGCFVQLFKEQGCGVTLSNQYHGYPFDSVLVGSTMACGNPVAFSYGAVEIVCE